MADGEKRSLGEIRHEIDAVDAQLVTLLSRRVELAQEVGVVKAGEQRPFFTPEREREVFERLDAINKGPLQTRQLVGIFREIISAARAAEKALCVAFWGPSGTFSHLASLRAFGSSSDFQPLESIAEVFQAVDRGSADYGVVPVENS